MKTTVHRQLGVLCDGILARLGLMRKSRAVHMSEGVIQGGHVFIDKKVNGVVVETVDLGSNTISYGFRIIVAKILARTEFATGITHTPSDGYLSTEDVFPVYLYVGTDNTPPTAEDTRLGHYLTVGDVVSDPPIRYSLARITVRDTKADYDGVLQPINVGFEFDIPDGVIRSAPYEETEPLLLREWGLSADDGADDYPITGAVSPPEDPQVASASPSTQLARKVVDVLKPFEMSLTVRWEIRT